MRIFGIWPVERLASLAGRFVSGGHWGLIPGAAALPEFKVLLTPITPRVHDDGHREIELLVTQPAFKRAARNLIACGDWSAWKQFSCHCHHLLKMFGDIW